MRLFLVMGCFLAALVSLVVWLKGNQDPLSTYQRAMVAVRDGDFEQAAFLSSKLLESKSHRAHGSLVRGFCLLAEGDPDAALLVFSDANQHPDTREESYFQAARICVDRQSYAEAIGLLRQVLAWNPRRAEACRLLAVVYFDIGAMEPALDSLQNVIELTNSDYRPFYLKATILQDYEQFEDAIQAFQAAADRLPNVQALRDEIALGTAECLVRLRRYEQVLRVLESCSPRAEILMLKADACFNLRRFDQAKILAEQILAERPEFVDALVLSARLLEMDGRNADAIALLQTAVEREPMSSELCHRMADVLGADGRAVEALEFRSRAVQIATVQEEFTALHKQAVTDTQDVVLRLKLADLAQQLQKSDLAEMWLKAALGMALNDPRVQDAWQQFLAGNQQ